MTETVLCSMQDQVTAMRILQAIISGSIVTDHDTTLTHIRQGANFRELKWTGSIRLVTLIKNQGGHNFQ